jgi:hypothetical protein
MTVSYLLSVFCLQSPAVEQANSLAASHRVATERTALL